MYRVYLTDYKQENCIYLYEFNNKNEALNYIFNMLKIIGRECEVRFDVMDNTIKVYNAYGEYWLNYVINGDKK